MKKIILATLGLTILGGSLYFLTDTKVQTTQNDFDEQVAESPEWFKQYAELKGQNSTIDRFGIKKRWFESDKSNALLKKSTSDLENVEEIGPDHVGGRTRSILIDYSNEDHLLAGGVSGGIWQSFDQGQSWEIVDDHAVTLSVTSITQSPFDEDVFYYGSGETYNNLLNENGLGVFRSTDGGESFDHMDASMVSAMNEIWDVQHSLVHDSTIYIGTNNGGLWISEDAGQTYRRIYNATRPIHEINAFADSTIQFGVDASGIFRLDENSMQVVELTNGLPTNGFTRISFDYCDAYPDVIYAQFLTSDYRDLYGTYKSSDGGDSWYTIGNSNNVAYHQGWYDFKLGVSPTDSNFVVAIAYNGGFTVNGGNNWGDLGFSHVDFHEIAFFSNGIKFLVGNDGGVYGHTRQDLTGRGTDLNDGYNVTQWYAGNFHPTESYVLAGAQDNNTRRYNASTSVWNVVNGGDGGFCAYDQQDDDHYYVSSQYCNIRAIGPEVPSTRRSIVYNSNFGFYNEIGGQAGTWFINPFEINPLDGKQIYVPTRRAIYASNNRGLNWEQLTPDLPGNAFAIGLSHDLSPTAYIGGTGSLIYRVDDAANQRGTQVLITSTAPIEFRGSTVGNIEVDPNDPGTIYVAMTNVANRPRIWKIEYANTDTPSFHNLHSNLPESLPVNWIEVDPENPNFLIIATDYGLYTSVNGGGWWSKDVRIPNVAVDMVRLRHFDRKLYIFTHGRGAFTAELAENPTSSVKPAETLTVNVYPNPVSDVLNVTVKGFDRMSLIDQNGRIVLTSQTEQMKVAGQTPGVYFLEVFADGKRIVKKVQLSSL